MKMVGQEVHFEGLERVWGWNCTQCICNCIPVTVTAGYSNTKYSMLTGFMGPRRHRGSWEGRQGERGE